MIMSEKNGFSRAGLQAARGFGVESPTGKVSLELREPQAEYRELRNQWDEVLKNGHTDAKTGTIVAMPMDQAKERFLQQNVKARSGPEAEKALNDSRLIISDGSSGRVASLKRLSCGKTRVEREFAELIGGISAEFGKIQYQG